MLTLDGVAVASAWPEGPGSYSEDVVRIDPAMGVAIVAAGYGVIGGQGQPAATLALWSVLGELRAAAATGAPIDAALDAGLARAHTAVERLTAAWRPGLHKPFATIAVLALDRGGDRAWVAHVGACRVSRVADAIAPLTIDHTVGRDHPEVPAHLRDIVTVALGFSATRDISAIPVAAGDRLLLAGPQLHRALPDADLRACADPDPARFAAALEARVTTAREYGTVAFAFVDVVDRAAPGDAIGHDREPPRSWLYAPGAPLPDPPTSLPDGPFPAWWTDVAGLAPR
ncbi:MAG: hypothetical protein K8W52_16170 [Deltaproteobacteria bacterium]|nr:hypothetical protein [Deltaproteobacteria bacterium]